MDVPFIIIETSKSGAGEMITELVNFRQRLFVKRTVTTQAIISLLIFHPVVIHGIFSIDHDADLATPLPRGRGGVINRADNVDFLRIGQRAKAGALIDGGGATGRDAKANHIFKLAFSARRKVIAPTMLSPAPTVLWLFIGGGTT
jgi:hypothetical protein